MSGLAGWTEVPSVPEPHRSSNGPVALGGSVKEANVHCTLPSGQALRFVASDGRGLPSGSQMPSWEGASKTPTGEGIPWQTGQGHGPSSSSSFSRRTDTLPWLRAAPPAVRGRLGGFGPRRLQRYLAPPGGLLLVRP